MFLSRRERGHDRVPFTSDDIVAAAERLGVCLPKNPADILYSFRFRTSPPDAVTATASTGLEWTIRLAGRSRYQFVLSRPGRIAPNEALADTKIPDATPGIISMYAFEDEQALLAKIRYNRLLDIFTGVACYSLQNHLRTTVVGMGQVEADELYVGVSKVGAHYAFPVEAKGAGETLQVLQIEQGYELCAARFPDLVCIPIGAQFVAADLIALFAFELTDDGFAISDERHYRLVAPDEVSPEDLLRYRQRPAAG